MIDEGDRIAVGVSGGKDSLVLLMALKNLQRFYPKKFELEAITISLGLENFDTTPIKTFCNEIGVNYTVEDTLIGKIIFETRNEKNPCSLCANMRRGALNNAAKQLNCNKVALAHSKDDFIETSLLSLFYEGNFRSFSPVTYLERKKIHVIRPLIYVEEKTIKDYVKKFNLTIVKNPCTADGNTKRAYIKDLITMLSKENKLIKGNIFGAIKRSNSEFLD